MHRRIFSSVNSKNVAILSFVRFSIIRFVQAEFLYLFMFVRYLNVFEFLTFEKVASSLVLLFTVYIFDILNVYVFAGEMKLSFASV